MDVERASNKVESERYKAVVTQARTPGKNHSCSDLGILSIWKYSSGYEKVVLVCVAGLMCPALLSTRESMLDAEGISLSKHIR